MSARESPTPAKLSTTPRVGVVILNWNGSDDTIECLASLLAATYPSMTIFVIDNASTDDSVRTLEAWMSGSQADYRVCDAYHPLQSERVGEGGRGKQLSLIRSNINLGFCRGNNLGMDLAVTCGAEYILILNNDTLVEPDFLEPMVEAAADEQVGLIGGVITHCDDPAIIWWAGGLFDRFLNNRRYMNGRPLSELGSTEPFSTEWISGCMMMIPTRIYREFGGFPEEYYIWAEEWDYSLRLSQAGYRHLVVPQARICHKVGRSLGIMQPLSYYYGIRNSLLLQRKYLRPGAWIGFIVFYLATRAARFTQLALQGRPDLATAGIEAVRDAIVGRTGQWHRQSDELS